MGGTTVATASTPGFGYFKHASGTFVACDCLREWLPVYERMLLAHGVIKQNLDIVQLTGTADASAGVHAWGAAFDLKQFTAKAIEIAREMGAPAYWARTGGSWAANNNEHGHGALSGCPHGSLVAYQITAQARGYNGLGQGWYNGQYLWGYGGKDPHPRPKVYRTFREGIAWALDQLKTLEDDMSAADVINYPLGYNPADGKTPVTLGYSVEISRNYSFRGWAEVVKMGARLDTISSALKVLADAHTADVTGDQILALVGAKVDEALSDLDSKVEAALADAEITLKVAPSA